MNSENSAGADLPRVALIGVTGYGRVHLDLILRNHIAGHWKFAAATVINAAEAPETIARLNELGVRIYQDYPAMLQTEERLDLVCIPTAIHWHARMTLDALAAGANVFVEKPLAGSVEEVQRILQAREQSGRFVAVGFQDLYSAEAWMVKDLIVSGRIGRLQCLKGIASWPRPLSYYERNGWAGKLRLDGHPVFDSPLNNALSHYLKLLLFFAGSERGRSAKVDLMEANLYRVQPIETFDTASIRGRTEGGADFFFHATHSSEQSFNPVLRIEGESGAVEWSLDHGVRLQDSSGITQLCEAGFQESRKDTLADALLTLLSGESPDFCTVEIAFEHVKWIHQLHSRFEPVAVSADLKELHASNQWVVPGLLPALQNAYENNILLNLS